VSPGPAVLGRQILRKAYSGVHVVTCLIWVILRTGQVPIRTSAFRSRAFLIGFWAMMATLCEVAQAIDVHAVVSRGDRTTAFVRGDDELLWCWGSNDFGQYGDGTTHSRVTGRPAPLPPGATGWRWFSGGLRFFAIDQQGRLFAWGEPEMPWGAPVSGSPNSRASSPVRLGNRTWKKAVAPVVTAQSGEVPFGLGVDEAGGLWWLRAPRPSVATNSAYSEYREDPGGLPMGAGPVEDVVGGGRCFVVRTQSGRVFVAGQASLGLLGPRSSLVGDSFGMEFVEVDPPIGAGGWARIAVVSNTVFAWTDQGGIYAWGHVYDAEKGTMIPMREPRFVPGAPSGLPIRQVVGQGYHDVAYLFIDENGEVSGCGRGSPVWPFFGSLLPDLFGEKTLMQLEPELVPVQAISSTTLLQLILGSDGRVSAKGRNEDGQLGTPVAPSEASPLVVPSGEAPFLSGFPADLPRLELVADPLPMIEPTNGAQTNGQSGRLMVVRSGRTDLAVSPVIQISTRLTNGLPNPDTNAVKVVGNAWLFPLAKLEVDQTDFEIPLPPSYFEAGDDSLWVDFTLLPSRWYDLGTASTATVSYEATQPENRTPQVRVLWPPKGATVYTSEYFEYVVELVDPDGYVAELTASHDGAWIPVPGVQRQFAASVPGIPRQVWIRVKPQFGEGEFKFGNRLTVTDDRGKRAVVQTHLVPGFNYHLQTGRHLRLIMNGRTHRLALPSTTGPLDLEESTDLKTWERVESFVVRSGLPAAITVPGDDAGRARFFRVRNPDMPVVTAD
jgi:hypothetical protein